MNVLDPVSAARDAEAARSDRPATALLQDSPDVRLIVFRLEPGQVVARHTSPSSVLLSVLAGRGVVSGGDGDRTVGPGDLISFEPREPHGMRATDQELMLLATITPRPGER